MDHVRKTDANVTDRRTHKVYSNKLRPTLCGSEPTSGDFSRWSALHIIGMEAIKPEWVKDMCPVCRQLVITEYELIREYGKPKSIKKGSKLKPGQEKL